MKRIQVKTNKICTCTAIPMQLANRFKYRPVLAYSVHTKPTISSKRQWSPAVPFKFRNLGDSKKTVPLKLCTKSPPLRGGTQPVHNKPRWNLNILALWLHARKALQHVLVGVNKAPNSPATSADVTVPVCMTRSHKIQLTRSGHNVPSSLLG